MRIGVPGMIGLLALFAFVPSLGVTGLLVGAVAVGLVYLAIGAAMTLGERVGSRKRDED